MSTIKPAFLLVKAVKPSLLALCSPKALANSVDVEPPSRSHSNRSKESSHNGVLATSRNLGPLGRW